MPEDKNPAQWAIDLIEKGPVLKSNPMVPILNRIGGFLFGAGAVAVSNLVHSKPGMMALHRHLIGGVVGVLAVELLARTPVNPLMSDAKVVEFIRLHPELFPEPQRVKFRDTLHDWKPIR